MVTRLVPEFDRARQTAVHDEFVARYTEHLCRKTACFPGTVDLVEGLREAGYTLAVFSNKRHDLTQRIVRHYFRPDVFRVVRGHVEGSPRKPDPSPTLELLSDLSADPARTVLIGDTAIDGATARRADLEFLGVGWGYRAPDTLAAAGARAVCERPGQIIEWLERGDVHDWSGKANAGYAA